MALKVGRTADKGSKLVDEIIDGFSIELNGEAVSQLAVGVVKQVKACLLGKVIPPLPDVKIARVVLLEEDD